MAKRRLSAAWERAIRRMVAELNADLRNHRMLADPWERAIHSMVGSWRIRHSMGRRRTTKRLKKPVSSWKEFTRRAALRAKREASKPRPGTWDHWAKLRTHKLVRYVPVHRRQEEP